MFVSRQPGASPNGGIQKGYCREKTPAQTGSVCALARPFCCTPRELARRDSRSRTRAGGAVATGRACGLSRRSAKEPNAIQPTTSAACADGPRVSRRCLRGGRYSSWQRRMELVQRAGHAPCRPAQQRRFQEAQLRLRMASVCLALGPTRNEGVPGSSPGVGFSPANGLRKERGRRSLSCLGARSGSELGQITVPYGALP